MAQAGLDEPDELLDEELDDEAPDEPEVPEDELDDESVPFDGAAVDVLSDPPPSDVLLPDEASAAAPFLASVRSASFVEPNDPAERLSVL